LRSWQVFIARIEPMLKVSWLYSFGVELDMIPALVLDLVSTDPD
jgi:hypothetical protein